MRRAGLASRPVCLARRIARPPQLRLSFSHTYTESAAMSHESGLVQAFELLSAARRSRRELHSCAS
jgi:hypothetical protein